MQRFISVLTICAAILMSIGFGAGLTHTRTADAKEDPEAIFRDLVNALNRGDVDAAGALLADDVTLFEPNGKESFGVVGKGLLLEGLAETIAAGFATTIQSAHVRGDTVTGMIATTDDIATAAGVDRYVEHYTARVVEGKIVSLDFLFKTDDPQTRQYLDYEIASDGDDGPPPGSIDVPLGAGANGNQPGTAVVFGEGGVTYVALQVEPGPAGAIQSADLVSGSCDAPGEVAYRLAAVVDGGSFTVIGASSDELLAQGLSVQVHQVSQPDRVNTCGAFAAPAPAPAPAPASPAPTGIKPPSTGMGPSPDAGVSPSWMIALALMGGVTLLAGVRVGRARP